MDSFNHFKDKVHKITQTDFNEFALNLFHFQANNNPIYKLYLNQLGVNSKSVQRIEDIPFLPIQFFKTQDVKTGDWEVVKTFKSSGTTQNGRSKHLIDDLDFYLKGTLITAENYFGSLKQFEVCALLPSYQEQGDSSLIEMVNDFTKHSHPSAGFYLKNHEELILQLNRSKRQLLVFGVSYALLDLAEQNKRANWSSHVFVETGGMKGRKKEITKQELHIILNKGFGTEHIHSEYGMTELMSQAYGKQGILRFPDWSKSLVRNLNDPFSISQSGSGGLNIIDLANIHSCAFIETEDIANVKKDGSFEVLGRLDNSDIRGCSLLI